MASSYSTNLKIELQATGENSGTWGNITNTNLGTALEQAIVGYGNPNFATDANLTLTYTDTNAAQAARALVLNVTSTGSLSVTRELIVPTIQKQYIVQNNTTGGQSITVKTSAGTGITVPNARKAHLYVDGTNVIYMDDFVDINGGAIDGTTIGASSASTGTFTTLTGTTKVVSPFLDAVGSAGGQLRNASGTSQLAWGAGGGSNLSLEVATNINPANAAVSIAPTGTGTVTINPATAGTMNNVAIGGSTAAAGSFTTLTTSSTVTLNGGTANGVLYLNASKVATSGSALTFDGTVLSATTVDATNVEVTNVKAKDGTAAITIADSTGLVTAGAGVTLSGGNLTFSSTAQRITGDMSNATFGNRLAFQTNVTNGATVPFFIPNGTGTSAAVVVANASDPTNCSFGQFIVSGTTEVRLNSGILGTGTYLPTTFQTGGSERVRIDTSGNVGIGTSSPGAKLSVIGAGAFTVNGDGSTTPLILRNDNTPASPLVPVVKLAFDNGGSVKSSINAAVYNNDYMTFNVGSDTERMRIDSSGNVGIGSTGAAQTKVELGGTYPTSSNNSFAVRSNGTFPSGATTNAISYLSIAKTQAASFTVSQLSHFYAQQSTIGAGSTVTNQFGFYVESSLTGATNNFGFYSNIASGSNRWNFYAAGTADNFFAGNTGIGAASGTAIRLRVKGSDTTSSNYAIYADNFDSTILFNVRNNGRMTTGTAAESPYNYTSASAANVFVDSNGTLFRSTSSLRYKSDVTDAAHGLTDVLKLRSVTYKGKNDGDKVFGGLIAEEVHDAGLTEFVAYDKEGRPDALHYGNMVALLVKAVQELTARVAELEAK